MENSIAAAVAVAAVHEEAPSLLALWRVAVATGEDEDRRVLQEALQSAPWGVQPDGSFVGRVRAGICGPQMSRLEHERLVLAVETRPWGVNTLAVFTREEAIARRRASRLIARRAHEAYLGRLDAVAAHLRAGRWARYCPGQCGGTVGAAREIVSADGVCRRVGLTAAEFGRALDDGWPDRGSVWFRLDWRRGAIPAVVAEWDDPAVNTELAEERYFRRTFRQNKAA